MSEFAGPEPTEDGLFITYGDVAKLRLLATFLARTEPRVVTAGDGMVLKDLFRMAAWMEAALAGYSPEAVERDKAATVGIANRFAAQHGEDSLCAQFAKVITGE